MPWPRRFPDAGRRRRIRFDAPARDIVNLVRAVARPYPGAFTQCDGRRLTIWKAAPIDPPGGESAAPGTVLHVEEDRFAVRCADAAVLVTDRAWDAPGPPPATGKVLGG
jgi:methionyl-tRNA formyltransferase